jgi:chromosome segregation ATPase
MGRVCHIGGLRHLWGSLGGALGASLAGMRTAGATGRGVGTGLPGTHPRGRRRIGVTLLAAVLAVGVAGAGPSTAVAPPARYPAPAPAAGGSDRISELARQIRAILAQLENTQARIDTLRLQRDQVDSELETALERRKRLNAEVKAAKKTAKATAAAEDAARAAYRKAKKARKSAKRELAAAQEALTAAQERYAVVAQAADDASDRVRRAEKRVRKAKSRKARSKAFTAWQMAAIDDRAAHARQAIADDRATDEFVGAQAAEAALTTAQYDRDQAVETRARAVVEAQEAGEVLESLTGERSRARSVVRDLRAEDETVKTELKAARKTRKKLRSRLDEVQRSALEVQQNLAGGRVRASGVLL